MKTSKLILAVAILVTATALGACAGESYEQGPTVELYNSADEGSADSIWGKTLDVEVTDTVTIEGTEHHGVTEIVQATSNQVRARSEIVVIPAGVDRVVDITADLDGYLSGWTSEVRFLLLYRLVGTEAWETVELEGSATSIFGGTRSITINFFDHVQLDPAREEMVIRDGENIHEDLTVPFEGAAGLDVEYGVFVFASSDWGDMEGDYDYVLTATCDDGACAE